jgi:hypothetical protein
MFDWKFINPATSHHKNDAPPALPASRPARLFADLTERLPYRDRPGKTHVCHWGQRKLLISEILFLLEYGHLFRPDEPKTVLYVGAASGQHIPFLADLFPDIHFILFDPEKFSIQTADSITICQEFFTESHAEYFSSWPNLMFFSDIRTLPQAGGAVTCKQVFEDMNRQRHWHERIMPLKSLLKFRLPFDPGKTEYLDGDLHLQAWSPIGSTEMRLVPDGTRTAVYDHTEVEEKLCHFQNVLRVQYYPHPFQDSELYDYCFDCAVEVGALRRLVQSGRYPGSVLDLAREINGALSSHGHTVFTRLNRRELFNQMEMTSERAAGYYR